MNTTKIYSSSSFGRFEKIYKSIRNYQILKIIIMTGWFFYHPVSNLFSQDIAPQIWNNVNLSWDIDDCFSFRSNIAYNGWRSKECPWNERTFSGIGGYSFERNFEFIFGVYLAKTKQSLNLSSFENRPYLGLRVFSNSQKRFMVSNLSRIELRHFRYSDDTNDFGARFRNRTSLSFAM